MISLVLIVLTTIIVYGLGHAMLIVGSDRERDE